MSTVPMPVFSMAALEDFNPVYMASLPPAVAAMMGIADYATRAATALELAQQGYVIDWPLQVLQLGSPYGVMFQRTIDSLTWVPSALQPAIALSIPGQNDPPFAPYNPALPGPAGSIAVSISPADYPPFLPPTPPPPPSINIVGGPIIGGTDPATGKQMYSSGPGAMVNGVPTVTNGQEVVQGGVTYTAKVYHWPFGSGVYFTA